MPPRLDGVEGDWDELSGGHGVCVGGGLAVSAGACVRGSLLSSGRVVRLGSLGVLTCVGPSCTSLSFIGCAQLESRVGATMYTEQSVRLNTRNSVRMQVAKWQCTENEPEPQGERPHRQPLAADSSCPLSGRMEENKEREGPLFLPEERVVRALASPTSAPTHAVVFGHRELDALSKL